MCFAKLLNISETQLPGILLNKACINERENHLHWMTFFGMEKKDTILLKFRLMFPAWCCAAYIYEGVGSKPLAWFKVLKSVLEDCLPLIKTRLYLPK